MAAASRCCLIALLVVGLGGCVGLIRTRYDWVEVTSEVRTRAEVLARFGEPRRKVHEADGDVWYYRLSGTAPSGRRPVTEGYTVLYAVIAPVWWLTRPDDNVRFGFDGDDVSHSGEVESTEHGFFCGVALVHRVLFTCGPMP
jgi:hypothetical protein